MAETTPNRAGVLHVRPYDAQTKREAQIAAVDRQDPALALASAHVGQTGGHGREGAGGGGAGDALAPGAACARIPVRLAAGRDSAQSGQALGRHEAMASKLARYQQLVAVARRAAPATRVF